MQADKSGRTLWARRMGCEPDWASSTRCAKPRNDLCRQAGKAKKPRRELVTRDTIQDLQINGLKRELSEFKRMFLEIVDPEDVRAAIRLRDNDINQQDLDEFGPEFTTPPPELFGKD